MSKPPPNVKKEWHLARQLCIYGDGDGRPIGSPEKLAELTGLATKTIRKYIEGWLSEREEMVSGSSTQTLELQLSAKELQLHKKDMIFLRSQIDQVEWEMANLESIIAKLEGICENFSLNTDNGDKALQLFDSYLRACANQQKLRQQFLQLQKQWTSLVGVDALQDIAVTRAKADATLLAKMDARKAEAAEGVRDVTPAGLGVFRRGGA